MKFQIFLIGICLFLYSCDSRKEVIKDCTPKIWEETHLDFSFPNISSVVLKANINFNEKNRSSFITANLSEEEILIHFKDFFNGTPPTTGINERYEAFAYILPLGYFENQADKMISFEDILGIIIYSKKINGGQYFLKSYSRKNNDVLNDNCSISQKSDLIVINHIYEIANCLSEGQDSDFFLAFNNYKRKSREDINNYKDIPASLNLQKKTDHRVPDPKCLFPCFEQENSVCVVVPNTGYPDDPISNPPQYLCKDRNGPSCLVITTEETVDYYSDTNDETLFYQQLYDFRDVFLYNSESSDYINSFYHLSANVDILSISFNTLYDLMDITPELIPKLNKLVDFKNGNNDIANDILYNSEFKNRVTDLIDRILLETSNLDAESIQILNLVKDDLEFFNEKTVSEIETEF